MATIEQLQRMIERLDEDIKSMSVVRAGITDEQYAARKSRIEQMERQKQKWIEVLQRLRADPAA